MEKIEEKLNITDIKDFKKECYGAILPHAGEKYAGDCRKTLFSYFSKDTKHIIYIAAIHNSSPLNTVYVFENNIVGVNKLMLGTRNINFTRKLDIYTNKEHSYKWVESELKEYFPDAKLLVLAPTKSTDLDILCDFIIDIQKNKKALIFATTDLLHYGKKFKNETLLKYPEQLNKMLLEETFLYDLCELKAVKPATGLNLCGLNSIKLFFKICKKKRWFGRVVDYYDSYGGGFNNFLDRYTIQFTEDKKQLVSYASMVFGKFTKRDLVLPIDIYMGLALLKTIIRYSVWNQDFVMPSYDIRLPKWCVFNKTSMGVFMGTIYMSDRTTCSYGNYQTENKKTSLSILNASKQCYSDALKRWKFKYELHNLDKILYKLELLQDNSKWITIRASDLAKEVEYKDEKGNIRTKKLYNIGKSKYGVYLTLENGNSATFLPEVYKSFNNIITYMNKLSLKAGGDKDDWTKKKAIAKLYTTNVFI